MAHLQVHFTKFWKFLAIAIVFVGLVFLFAKRETNAVAGINRTINFQGKLVNNPAKTNVSDTSYTVVFTIYDRASGGTALWTETQTVTTADGIFRVALGSQTPFPNDFNFNWDGLYLGMKVGSDSEMTPRVQLAAVPYAFNAQRVSGLTVQDDSGNASTSGTLRMANGKTVTFSNGLTFAGADSKTINFGSNSLTFTTSADSSLTLPASGTLATLAGVESLTNKTIGSTGLTFSGAGTDITTATNEDFILTPNGTGNMTFSGDFNSQVLIGSTSLTTEFPLLINNGIGSNATLAIVNPNSGDLLTASAGASTKFTVTNGGSIQIAASQAIDTLTAGTLNIGNSTANTLLLGNSTVSTMTFNVDTSGNFVFQKEGSAFSCSGNDKLTLNGSGQLVCGTDQTGSGGTNLWQQVSGGVLAPGNLTQDLLLGGTATTGAKFAFINAGSTSTGTSTASISANSGANSTYLTGAGILGTTNRQTLTIGDSTTGNIALAPGGTAGTRGLSTTIRGGSVSSGTATGGDLTITAGDGRCNSVSPGCAAGGNLTIDVGDNPGGDPTLLSIGTANDATAINLGTGTSVATITIGRTSSTDLALNDANWSISGAGAGTFNTLTLSGGSTDITSAANEELVITPNGTGNLTLTGDFNSQVLIGSSGLTTEFPLLVNNGIGSNATLAINNPNSGDLFTASASGTTRFTISNSGSASMSGSLVMAGANSIQTTSGLTLTIGGSTTGDIQLNPSNSDGVVHVNDHLDVNRYAAFGAEGALSISDPTNIIHLKSNYAGSSTAYGIYSERYQYNAANANAVIGVYGQGGAFLDSGTHTLAWARGVAGKAKNAGGANQTITSAAALYAMNSELSAGSIGTGYGLYVEDQTSATANYGIYVAGGNTHALHVASDDVAFMDDLFVGAISSTIASGSFAVNGDDLFVSGQAGVEGLIFSDTGININNGAFAIDSAGAITASTGLTLTSGAITLGGSTGSGQCITGGATASWGSCGSSSGGSNWTLDTTNKVLRPNNNTVDFLLGGTATNSAKFAVLNLNSGVTTATVSGNLIVMPTAGAGGNVGIGTINPAARLEIAGGGLLMGYQQSIALKNSIGTPVTFSIVDTGTIGPNSGKLNTFRIAYGGSNGWELGNTDVGIAGSLAAGNANIMSFQTATTERMRIDATGNLGLGTASPISQFHVTKPLSFGATGKALAIFDQIENQDIIAASKSGVRMFTVNSSGNLALGGVIADTDQISATGFTVDDTGIIYSTGGLWNSSSGNNSKFIPSNNGAQITRNIADSNAALQIQQVHASSTGDILQLSNNSTTLFAFKRTGGVALSGSEGTNGDCLKSGGSAATVTWGSCGSSSGGGSNWTLNTSLGILRPNNNTTDLILGGTASASAKFQFTNMISGNPTLKIFSSDSSKSLNLFHDGTNGYIQTSAGELVIGNGSSSIFMEDAIVNDTANNSGALRISDKFHVVYSEAAQALALFNNTGAGDIITASASGSTRFVLDTNGQLRLRGGQTSDIDTLTATTLRIGVSNANALNLGNSTISTMTFNVDTAGNFNFQKEGSAFNCSGTDKLTLSSGNLTCATDQTGGGGPGGSSNWTLDSASGVLRPNNNTLDLLIGGTSTASAKFAILNVNNGGVATASVAGNMTVMTINGAGGNLAVGTTSASERLTVEGGNVMIGQKPNSAANTEQTWTKVSGTAGTIGTNVTTGIASPSAMAVFNGSLYAGTTKTNGAEVYRYQPETATSSAQWVKVSQTMSGQIASGGTANIDAVSAMTVYNGKLYIGTTETNAAQVYRYDGGNSWTVLNSVAGTFDTTANVDGVSAMTVNRGSLFIGTAEVNAAQVLMYQGGTTWVRQNGTAGTIGTASSDGVSAMTSFEGSLHVATYDGVNRAEVVRRVTGNSWTILATTGSFTNVVAQGSNATNIDRVTAMTVYGGSLYAAIREPNGADLYRYGAAGAAGANSWTRMQAGAGTGQLRTGGTSGIDAVSGMAIYNGVLYVGTEELNSAQIYRFNGSQGDFTLVSQTTVGQISAGGTSNIDMVSPMLQFNDSLYVGTWDTGNASAEVYRYTASINQSFALKFRASVNNNTQIHGNPNIGSISFLASPSGQLNHTANTGSFLFSHSILTNTGAYDVAEDFPTRDETLEPGDLVATDNFERQFVKKSDQAYQPSVIGVYSENPAMRLSQSDANIDGGRAIPVALAGRVPVKVSNENGVIKQGDYLASSSVPGVAMKATKASAIIGVAMEEYEGEGIGKVIAYIKSSSYDGSIADAFAGIDVASETFGQEILSRLENQTDGLSGSDIVTDRIVASIEIVTPKLTVDELFAKKIKAEQIELPAGAWLEALSGGGLESINSQIADLRSQILGISDKIASSSAVASSSATLEDKTKSLIDQLLARELEDASESATRAQNGLSLKSLNVDGLSEFEDSVRVKGNGLFENLLTVLDTLTTQNFIANGLSTFFGETIFKDKVEFEKNATFASDTGGIATIKKNAERVEVEFDEEFEEAPIVNASVSFDETKDEKGNVEDTEEQEIKFFQENYSYIIVNKSKKGFVIVLNKKAKDDVTFTWTALQVKDARKVQSRIPKIN